MFKQIFLRDIVFVGQCLKQPHYFSYQCLNCDKWTNQAEQVFQTSHKHLMHIKSAWHQGLCGCSFTLCLIFVSPSYLTLRHRKNLIELFMQRILHGSKIVLLKLQDLCFTVKSETQCCASSFWYVQYYICHCQTTATCSQQGKHHMSSKQCKHANTHANRKSHSHKPLYTTHNFSCPEGYSL